MSGLAYSAGAFLSLSGFGGVWFPLVVTNLGQWVIPVLFPQDCRVINKALSHFPRSADAYGSREKEI